MVQTSDQQYLILTMFSGFNYDEQTDGNSYFKHPFRKTFFEKEELRFNLSGFKMVRTDEDLFKKNYMMLNLKQLNHATDSLKKQYSEAQQIASANVLNSLNYLHQWSADKSKKKLVTDTVLRNKKVFAKNFHAEEWSRITSTAANSAREVQSSLDYYRGDLTSQQEVIRKHEVEWQRKFTLSIACLILFFVGAPMGAIIRKGGLGLPLILAVLFFVLYHVISMTGEKAAKAGGLDVITGMWLSSIVLLPIGIYLTYKATTDSPLLDADAYVKFINRFFSRLGIIKKEKTEE
jgi:lipopolysaccharide export system permease protein